jgi:signal-transduction protein with cAMP-binding, CBS, and nucleotidyltransferase domain
MNEEDVRSTLAKSPVLADLDPTALMFLVRLGHRRTFQTGEILMRQGEPSNSIHFLLSGKVRAERARRSDDRPVTLAELEAGAVVGEMGVMIDIPRSAFDDAEPLVSRLIGFDIARYVLGGDAEFRRRAAADQPLQKALELAHGARTEGDLIRKATAQAQPPDSLAAQ